MLIQRNFIWRNKIVFSSSWIFSLDMNKNTFFFWFFRWRFESCLEMRWLWNFLEGNLCITTFSWKLILRLRDGSVWGIAISGNRCGCPGAISGKRNNELKRKRHQSFAIPVCEKSRSTLEMEPALGSVEDSERFEVVSGRVLH